MRGLCFAGLWFFFFAWLSGSSFTAFRRRIFGETVCRSTSLFTSLFSTTMIVLSIDGERFFTGFLPGSMRDPDKKVEPSKWFRFRKTSFFRCRVLDINRGWWNSQTQKMPQTTCKTLWMRRYQVPINLNQYSVITEIVRLGSPPDDKLMINEQLKTRREREREKNPVDSFACVYFLASHSVIYSSTNKKYKIIIKRRYKTCYTDTHAHSREGGGAGSFKWIFFCRLGKKQQQRNHEKKTNQNKTNQRK